MNVSSEAVTKAITSDDLLLFIQKERNRVDITMESHFADDLGMDSLDQADLVMALEKCYGVTIDDSKLEKLQRVKDAIMEVLVLLNATSGDQGAKGEETPSS